MTKMLVSYNTKALHFTNNFINKIWSRCTQHIQVITISTGILFKTMVPLSYITINELQIYQEYWLSRSTTLFSRLGIIKYCGTMAE